jgi:hypothetical protein
VNSQMSLAVDPYCGPYTLRRAPGNATTRVQVWQGEFKGDQPVLSEGATFAPHHAGVRMQVRVRGVSMPSSSGLKKCSRSPCYVQASTGLLSRRRVDVN